MKPGREHARDDARRLEAAADWMLRLRDDVASEEDILRWMKWCEADRRNQQAFDRVQELWALSGGLASDVRDGDLPEASASRTATARTRVERDSAWLRRWSRLRAFPRPLALGFASAVVVVVAALTLLNRDPVVTVGEQDTVAGRPTETVREARLSDGSVVQLAAASAVSIDYTESERALDLRGGEAYFTVARDEARPFVVAAGEIRIRAVGTAFNVRRSADRVVVTVTDGTVEIYRTSELPNGAAVSGSVESVTVPAGSQVRWGGGDPNPVLASVDPTTALAWREGRLEYTNEPLGAVVADLNRYSERPVIIEDDTIERFRFSGTVLTSATAEWLRALPRTLPVNVENRGGVYVILPRTTDIAG